MRKIGNLSKVVFGTSLSLLLGCSTLDISQEQRIMDYIRENPGISVETRQKEMTIVNGRGYEKGSEKIPERANTEIVEVTPTTKYLVPSINAEYIKSPEGRIIMTYNSRLLPETLREKVEPHLSGIGFQIVPEQNELILYGNEESFSDMGYITSIINQMDQPPRTIRAKIAILDFSKNKSFNMESFLSYLRNDKVVLETVLASTGGGTPLPFGINANPFYESERVEGLISLLKSNAQAEVLAKVNLLLTNGVETSFDTVISVPYTDTVITSGVTVKESSVYRPTGMQLKLTGSVNKDNHITLNITQAESGEQIGVTERDANPIFRESNLVGKFTLGDSELKVLVSSETTKTDRIERGLPLLDGIPMLSGKQVQSSQRDIVYLLWASTEERGAKTEITGLEKELIEHIKN